MLQEDLIHIYQYNEEGKYHPMQQEGPNGKSCLENAFKTLA